MYCLLRFQHPRYGLQRSRDSWSKFDLPIKGVFFHMSSFVRDILFAVRLEVIESFLEQHIYCRLKKSTIGSQVGHDIDGDEGHHEADKLQGDE